MKKVINKNSIVSPFATTFIPPGGSAASHYANSQIPSFRCPSFSGDNTTTMDGVFQTGAATGNYCALVATDMTPRASALWKTSNNWENGALPSACWSVDEASTPATNGSCTERGIRLKNLGDGISKTMIACESREEEYNAWISGACMWVAGASPNSLSLDGVTIQQAAGTGFIEIPEVDTGSGLALNHGTEATVIPTDEQYLESGDWVTAQDRIWGPSSEHSGNIVIHVFADAHAQAISAEVDSTTYLRFISRSAGDPADASKFE
jgi:hypothetical protein